MVRHKVHIQKFFQFYNGAFLLDHQPSAEIASRYLNLIEKKKDCKSNSNKMIMIVIESGKHQTL